MTESEKLIEKSFLEYSSAGTARLMILFAKMRVAGNRGGIPLWVQVAKAPYDIAGYYVGSGRHIAAEIKENAERKASLPIIGPDKKGTGLHYHQLEALVNAHDGGALAAVLWDNAGEWLYLPGDVLKTVKRSVDTEIKARLNGYPNTRGAMSIRAELFRPIKLNGNGVPLWLPPESISWQKLEDNARNFEDKEST